MKDDTSDFAAIVLAAGASRRMGTAKALLPIEGKPMLLGVVQSLLDSSVRIAPIVIVTGHQRAAIESALASVRDRIECAHNPAPDAGGMLSSIKIGLTALRDRAKWIFIVLGDQPLVRAGTIELLARSTTAAAPVIRPKYQDKHGHPILLDAACIDLILKLQDGATLNDFVKSARAIDIEVSDPATIQDIDTPADYRAATDRRGR